MMRKRILFSVIAVVLLACVLCAAFACESYKAKALSKVGDKNAVVESNGGLVVKQGGYLYFINGYTGYLTEKGKQNWFGKVQKGAIVRVTYNEDGTLGDDYVVVVPKSVMADSENVGFSIFGEWIYYVSPSAEEDRSGAVQTSTLQFMRTKIDGTGTQVILNWDDTSVKYKYTANALVFFDSANGKLYSKALNVKKFKKNKPGDLIDEDVAAVHFVKNETYDPKADASVADYVLYTKKSEDAYEYSNTLYISDARGSKDSKKAVIGADSYADGKYSISVVASSVTDEKLAIYYTKTSYVGTSSSGTVVGTYAYQFSDKTFAFAAANEVCLSTEDLSTLSPISYAEGVVKTGSNARIYYTDGREVSTFGALELSTFLCVKDNCFYYLNGDGILLYYPVTKDANAHYAYTTGEKFMTSFTGAEYFDGYFYFIQDDDYDYMSRVKLSEIDIYSGKDATVTRVALITAADKTKMEEAEKKTESEK